MNKNEHLKILLYDGDCSVCNKSVQFVLKWNSRANIYFASLNSNLGTKLLKKYKLDYDELSTVVFIDDFHAYIKSDAALKIANYLDKPIYFLRYFKIIPKTIRDFSYDFLAKYRYKIIKKNSYCIMPIPEIKNRFLS